MANALKLNGYDFHISFGKGTHNPSQGEAEMPESMAWLWRDYDPAKTEQKKFWEGNQLARRGFSWRKTSEMRIPHINIRVWLPWER